ncbi:hypothetical protein H3H37_22285 [Duganella sp. LX20W]|uniref:Uncharacterized protein n=1 Tax=Rugamonas brunnea TaxID=2758569 RepID=A0A7W2IDU9_9BURK|nr:hypothetical protein [Rugamonas brunnea]MBA5639794.1 hypothetical protein [Rugamonas brunnea]
MKNEVIPSAPVPTIDGEVRNLLDLAASLEAHGVQNAMVEGGTRYVRDTETGSTIVATRDVIVKKTSATLGVMIALPGASQDEVLKDLNSFTQELRGAVVGRSQSWVSDRTAD